MFFDLHFKKFPRPDNWLDSLNVPRSPACKLDLKELVKYEKHRKSMYKLLFMKIFERNFESFWD